MRKLDVIKSIYSHPLTWVANIAAAAVYYLLFVFLIKSQNSGIFLITVPAYLVYLLVITASVLFAVNLYSIRFVLPGVKRNVSEGFASAVMASAGGLIGGCSCGAPLAAGLLYFIGFNALAVGGFIAYVSRYQYLIFPALILVNLLLIYYTVSKLSLECKLKGGGLAKR